MFLRRVNSRILYEQMIGRATRMCHEIGKEVFRIFDAVDLYPHLQNLTDMKPVVVNPALSFEQLLQELTSVTDDGHRAAIRDQLAVKWSRKLRRLADEARAALSGAPPAKQPEATLDRIRNDPPAELANGSRAGRQSAPSSTGARRRPARFCRFRITPTRWSASRGATARPAARGLSR